MFTALGKIPKVFFLLAGLFGLWFLGVQFLPLLILTILVILGAEFVNGWTDAPNAITTVVSTRALSLRKSIALATFLNIAGAMSGTAVAATIGKGIVDSQAVDLITIAASMWAIILWSTIALNWGLPTSESHALIAGLSGAGLAAAGPDVLLWTGWQKVFIGLAFSTTLGLFGAFVLTRIIRRLATPFPPRTTQNLFRKLQILSAGFMAFSHGSNDGQKFIGVFALALVLGGAADKFSIPFWVVLSAAGVMGLGTSFGGWRIIRTMGLKMLKLQPYQGFSAESVAGLTILGASQFGIPLSTTHTIGTSIMGSGIAHRKSALKLNVIKQIILAWLLTFPICGAIAYALTLLLRTIL